MSPSLLIGDETICREMFRLSGEEDAQALLYKQPTDGPNLYFLWWCNGISVEFSCTNQSLALDIDDFSEQILQPAIEAWEQVSIH